MSDLFERDAGECDKMKIRERRGPAFIVFDKYSEAGFPCEGSFDDPTSGQQHEAVLCLGELDDLESDALHLGGLCRPVSGVALIDDGDVDAVLGGDLNDLGHTADLGAVIGIGGRDVQGEQMTGVSTARCSL